MAEQTPEVPETVAEKASSENMDVETNSAEDLAAENGGAAKRPREEGDEPDNDENGDASKKTKVQNPEEEQKVETFEEKEGAAEGEKKEDESGPVTLGPKTFGSSVEMFDYFYKLLHSWSPNLNVNKVGKISIFKKGASMVAEEEEDGVAVVVVVAEEGSETEWSALSLDMKGGISFAEENFILPNIYKFT
nr:protein DCL, chloroplastic-like [Ipomoea batatas]